MIQMSLLTKQKETHRLIKRTYGRWGEGIVREFGKDRYTLLYLKWVTNKDLLYRTRNSAQYYVAAWMGGQFRRKQINVYVWLSPFAVHLKLSQNCLLISYIHQYKTSLNIYILFPKIQSIIISNHFGFPNALPYDNVNHGRQYFQGHRFYIQKKKKNYLFFCLALLYLSQHC